MRLSLCVSAPVVWDHVGSKDNPTESVGSNTICVTQHTVVRVVVNRARETPLLRASMDRCKRVADCHKNVPSPTVTRVPRCHLIQPTMPLITTVLTRANKKRMKRQTALLPPQLELASNHNRHSSMVPADAPIPSQEFSPPVKIRYPSFVRSRQIFCSITLLGDRRSHAPIPDKAPSSFATSYRLALYTRAGFSCHRIYRTPQP